MVTQQWVSRVRLPGLRGALQLTMYLLCVKSRLPLLSWARENTAAKLKRVL